MRNGTRGTAAAWALVPLYLIGPVACTDAPPNRPAGAQATAAKLPSLPANVLAQVNDVAITAKDVELESAPQQGHEQAAPATQTAVLYAVVQKELAAQRALALGLASDPGFQKELKQHETELQVWKRRRLSELFFRKQVDEASMVDDTEARKYYDANVDTIGSEPHLLQILVRDEARAQDALKALQAGTPFEEVARSQYPGLPPSVTPWDLGFVKWNQMPDAWSEALRTLSPGQTSGVLRGPKDRFWILRLVEKRKIQPSFEAQRAAIVSFLRNQKIDARRKAVEAELQAQAQVVYQKSALGLPATAAKP